MKTYYAELNTSFEIKPCDEVAGTYSQFAGIHGGIDLHRFSTKKDRDCFVNKYGKAANIILAAEAKKEHKEQFSCWK